MAHREGAVQQGLAAHVPTAPSHDAPTFFYDLTSTYVDRTISPLADILGIIAPIGPNRYRVVDYGDGRSRVLAGVALTTRRT